MNDIEDLFKVPEGTGFFYGSLITATEGSTFRIPFTEQYGTPSGFNGNVFLPLSGDKRIHNIGLYTVEQTNYKPFGEPCSITLTDGILDERYNSAIHFITARDERRIAVASKRTSTGKKGSVDIGAFSRLNIMSEPFNDTTGIASMTLSMPVKTSRFNEALFIRVHDPAVPSRLWNQFAVNLKGFNKGYETLNLTIDMNDLVLTGGDRFWIDLGTAGKCILKLCDSKQSARLFFETVPIYIAVDAYTEKEIISSKAQYSKMYEYMPWQFTGRTVKLEEPYCFGGPFDIILPALAIKRVKPDHFTANYMIRMSGTDFFHGHPVNPQNAELITITDPYGAPDWAVYMRDFNRKRHAIAVWWGKRQNSDGQVGGGWNDDTLFISFHQADLPLDSNENARAVIDTIQTKFERTGLFRDGFCQIYPIDRMHAGDFISERYNTFVNNLGQAYAAEREMESARHLDHPEETPFNYAQGIPFKSSVNVFKWYWGSDIPEGEYISKPLDALAKEFRLYTSLLDEYYFYRMTESNVHRDDFSPYGAQTMYTYMLGGNRGARWDAHLKLAVMWPSGGGPDIARIIMKASDSNLEAVCYSFDDVKRDLKMRLCRIKDGHYKIGLYADPQCIGSPGDVLWKTESELKRFDVVTLPIPHRTPLVIKVEQIEEHDRPEKLPDLVIDPWDATFKGSTITVTVHNIGNGDVENIPVRLYNGEKMLQEKNIARLNAPTDFIAKRTKVTFSNVPPSRNLNITVDPMNVIPEILEENNHAKAR